MAIRHIHIHRGPVKDGKGTELLRQYEAEFDKLEKDIEEHEDRGVTVPSSMLQKRKDLQLKIKGAKDIPGSTGDTSFPQSVQWRGSKWIATGKTAEGGQAAEYEEVDSAGKKTGNRAWRSASGTMTADSKGAK